MDLFTVGMDRVVPEYQTVLGGHTVLNLGAGYKYIQGADNLSAETGWRAPMLIGYESESVDTVFALHFLEHLEKANLLTMLKEIERVLHWGGVLNVVVPWYGAQLAYQDLDHKTFWTVETWKNLLDNKYYDGSMPRDWKLKERFSLIMGLSDRNVVVVSQLEKV
jgi:predicted SAM-dependent methyltransferase